MGLIRKLNYLDVTRISRSLCKGLVQYPAKYEEIYGFISCYITFNKKTSTCGSQVGHNYMSLLDCSVGQWVK